MMIRNCCMLVAGLLLHTQIFAQDKTAASRTGEDYTLSNGAVEAVFQRERKLRHRETGA